MKIVEKVVAIKPGLLYTNKVITDGPLGTLVTMNVLGERRK